MAEFIVAKALNIPLSVRNTWDNYDLKTPDGIKIEIKSGAFLQGWEQDELSKIVFTGLCGQAWDTENSRRDGDEQFRADIYIFVVQNAKKHDEFSQLDLAQWEFYLLPHKVLQNRGTKSMSLTALKKLVEPAHFSDLSSSVNNLKQEIVI